MNDIAKCKLCGAPMPEGEEMFFYHGLSGPCPKAAIDKPAPLEIWVVLDEHNELIHSASREAACHEHINDAINEHKILEARNWVVRKATLAA